MAIIGNLANSNHGRAEAAEQRHAFQLRAAQTGEPTTLSGQKEARWYTEQNFHCNFFLIIFFSKDDMPVWLS